ncbi:MAG: NAD-dependent epimerase/dehydratase family protein, partial [Anaerolineae bacterium]|nr:NAD-dependent epimerase/dehydratase family protein [Anaerolineae bacterium]
MDNALTERQPLSIFLTGAASPLGQVLTRKLIAAGHQVVGLTPTATLGALIRANGALPVYADPARAAELKNAMTLRKTDVVIHIASQTANHVPARQVVWDSEAQSMVRDTEVLTEAAAGAGVKFFVHTSYAFVYGDHHGAWVDETTRPEPHDHALLKAALTAEKKALNAAVPGCVLRLGYLYGAEVDGLHDLVNTLRAGRSAGSDAGYASWVSLVDAAEALRRAAEAQIAGGIYNIVDDTPASSADFLKHFAGALGLQLPDGLPKFLTQFLPRG